MALSIAVGSIFIECNHLGGVPADLAAFERGGLFVGDAILSLDQGTVGGMLSTLRNAGAVVRPLVVASACPSGPVTAEAYDWLKREMLARLAAAGPIDGVLLALHGAAAVESLGDLEGDLLASVRQAVGDSTPVVATLDLHAHVTHDMVDSADALVAWETYPHRDAFETGERGARALLDIASGRLKPTMALSKVPVIVGGVLGHTEGAGPFADVMRLAKSFEKLPGVYSTSAFLVHPYLKLPDMGGGGLVITHDDQPLAQRLADDIARLYWEKRLELVPLVFTPADAIARGLAVAGGPVTLIETADCCGGGAAGDSAATFKALLAACPDSPSLVPIVDPPAAAACHEAGVGATLTLDIGHHVDPAWGQPVRVTGVVERLSDGRFTYRGGIWEGQTGQMGPSAVFRVGQIRVALATHATYEWCGEQYELLGLDARHVKFVVAKNPMNYRMAFGPFAAAEFLLDTPGPTPAVIHG